MSTTSGIALIAVLAFIISMLVAFLIRILAQLSSIGNRDTTGTSGNSGTTLSERVRAEFRHFTTFQRSYRTYWDNGNAPTNELIAFYHEQ